MEAVFVDLASRFVSNLPAEDLSCFERLLFQIEEAHWFYEDFHRVQNKKLPKFNLKQFANAFFKHVKYLQPHEDRFFEVFKKFRRYYGQIPVCGIVMLDRKFSRILLVRHADCKHFGFPKGKMNKGEEALACAVREAKEEVGFDVTPYVSTRAEDIIHVKHNQKHVKLYVVRLPEENIHFETQTRNEIAQIRWISLRWLEEKPEKFVSLVKTVAPKILLWVQQQKQQSKKRNRNNNKGNNKGSDAENKETFGAASVRWTPKQMFADNERLFGIRPTVDGRGNRLPKPPQAAAARAHHPNPVKAVKASPLLSFKFDRDSIMHSLNSAS